MYALYAPLPPVPQFSEMEEMSVSSEEYYRAVGERDRFEIDIQEPERSGVEIEM
mgnify:CR=1 FL=1|jgi:hypothetical protein|tara:strand:+ start:2939 stop:3100 length:162 start_codon:yes stop_codon:yes gene_type:complete